MIGEEVAIATCGQISANTGLPTSLRFVQIAFGDFGNHETVMLTS